MGTSTAYGGPAGGTPLIPSWLGGADGVKGPAEVHEVFSLKFGNNSIVCGRSAGSRGSDADNALGMDGESGDEKGKDKQDGGELRFHF